MATVEDERQLPDDATVLDWRFEVLIHAGYHPNQAWELATSKEVDIRNAERLLAQGCPSGTAVRILL
jgi:hypothetical protein